MSPVLSLNNKCGIISCQTFWNKHCLTPRSINQDPGILTYWNTGSTSHKLLDPCTFALIARLELIIIYADRHPLLIVISWQDNALLCLCLCVDGLACNLALCGDTQCGPWPGYRGGLLYDDCHLPHTKVHFPFPLHKYHSAIQQKDL